MARRCTCGRSHSGSALVEKVRRVVSLVEATSAPTISPSAAVREEMFADMQLFRRQYGDTLRAMKSGALTPEGAEKAIEKLLSDNYEKAYRQGLRSFGSSRFTDFDARFVRNAVKQEMRFARKFIDDISTGQGVIPYGERASYYGRGYEALYRVGEVQALPWETDIYWRLGTVDHCVDCVALASASPFSKATLPVVPGSGGTQCLFNCGCSLVYKQRPPRKSELARPASREELARLSTSPIPEGLRAPAANEIEVIRGHWGDVQYHRTAVRFSPSEMKGAHVAARRDANSALIDYLEGNDLHWTRGAEDALFNPPPGGGVGGGFARGGRTGIESAGSTEISGAGAGSPVADPALFREPVADLGTPEKPS